MAEQQQQNTSLGALWGKKTKNNDDYYTGNVEINGQKVKIVVFQNKRKNNESSPDLIIYESRSNFQNQNNKQQDYI